MEMDKEIAVESKQSVDIEVQVQEVNAVKDESYQDNALLRDWDLPDNKENPKNWSSCRYHALLTEA